MKLKSYLGANLKAWRQRYNFSLEDIALDTGLSKAFLSQIETGASKKPSAETAYILWKRTAIDKDWALEIFCFNPITFK